MPGFLLTLAEVTLTMSAVILLRFVRRSGAYLPN